MEKAVSISHLKKSFGNVEALRGVDLEVAKGQIFGFLGPNGAGKSTTLKILTTLLPYDEGSVSVAGFDVNTHPQEVRKRIGYVSQTGGADKHSTGFENLILQGQLYGYSKADSEKKAKELISTFDLNDCIQRVVNTYSGGQQRRLDIALGMMNDPEILFLDEPTNGLDPQNRANLWEKIQKLRSEGITIFLTSHYLDEVDFLSDSLAIMDQGQIVAQGTAQELKKQISGDVVTIGIEEESHDIVSTLFDGHEFVREVTRGDRDFRLYVEDGGSALPHILRLLDKSKISLESIQMSVPTLNDVFLKKTGRSLREEATK